MAQYRMLSQPVVRAQVMAVLLNKQKTRIKKQGLKNKV